MTGPPCVFSIPPTVPFLATLADALLAGELVRNFPRTGDPLGIARATIYLPTRRACRELSDIFREKNIVPHPKLCALGEFDESGDLFGDEDAGIGAPDLPPNIPPLERQMILSRLIMAWARGRQANGTQVLTPSSPADALHLAAELMRLLDMLTNEGLEIGSLQKLPPPELQQHWESAYEFLKVASDIWPNYLKTERQMEPAQRRRLMMQAEAARLMDDGNNPVIAAGSTGSVPITAEFLMAIARHPQGALVLPGLDRDLDEDSWQLVAKGEEPGHPQTAMASLLQKLKITRHDVQVIDGNPLLRGREHIISEIMRPAATSDAWSRMPAKDHIDAALENVALIEAAHEHEEALAIACILRETLEQEGATAALVTPDRRLARLVASELKRFGLQVDDSAGAPLNATPAGIFARLVAEAALHAYESAGTLSLLKHPLCALKQDNVDEINGAIERLLFRGFSSAGNFETLQKKFDAGLKTESAKHLSAEQRSEARGRFELLHANLSNFAGILRKPGEQPLKVFLDAHLAALLACAATRESDGISVLAATPDGKALLDFFEMARKAQPEHLPLQGADYPLLFNSFAAQISVRPVQFEEPRLRIYGLLEARLIAHDRLVLGGLNEGVWPQVGQNDLWLSRGMRASLDLPSPERRIGLAAHDFAQGLGAKDVWLTRALKSNGAPGVPSRFVQRLAAVVGEKHFEKIRARGAIMLKISRKLDEASAKESIARPAPSPPFAARPRKLSVTDIEKLLRDPYAIYAQHILQLEPFEPLDKVFDSRQRGLVIHETLSEFAKSVSAGEKPGEALLENIARQRFAPFLDDAEVKAYWWPRFRALIPELVTFEIERRQKASAIATEERGKLTFPVPAGTFTLSARADRIEKKGDVYALIDFKTGQLPQKNRIDKSFALQLTLQAAMLEQGAFGEMKGIADELIYIGLAKPGEIERREVEREDLMAFARETLSAVRQLIEKFDSGAPYTARGDSPYAASSSDYAHLARVREWGLAGEEEAGA
jgi:ATP-dependent helicase/nuclease subunit B